MSRAFVTENDSWEYCPKAGERCMMAEKDKECRDERCEHALKIVDRPTRSSGSRDKFVRIARKK